MNVLGHALVADRARPGDDLHTLGAVLPDLTSMTGVRLATDRPRDGSALADGIACHHAADAAFHALPVFVTGVAALRAELADVGLARGPARAVAHAGFELLLDGALAGTGAEHAYRAALAHAAGTEVVAVIAAPHRARWLGACDRLRARTAFPVPYDDPVWIAERLHARLRDRPRLAFAAADVAAVAAVLERHAHGVRAAAPGVVTALGRRAFGSAPEG